jgi:filamentous hemagglutinin
MDVVHGALDIIGFIDPTPLADTINGYLYQAEGRYSEAAISFAAALLPALLGSAAYAAKWGLNAYEAADSVSDIARITSKVDDIASTAAKTADYTDEVAESISEAVKYGEDATDALENAIKNSDEAIDGARKAMSPSDAANQIVNADRIGTAAAKSDPGHRAASFLTQEQLANGQTFIITGGDGVDRTLLQVTGEMDDIAGIFEYILTPEGYVSHQRFIKNGVINGVPNQVVPKP